MTPTGCLNSGMVESAISPGRKRKYGEVAIFQTRKNTAKSVISLGAK
jgi:hypothetical protein